jgi:hypothetical protein
MPRIWRWITPVAVAGGLVAGVPAIQAATASTAAGSIITINATSPHYPGLRAKDHGLVDGYAIVIYRLTTKSANTGVVSGKVTTTATNDTATLLAEPFGAKTFSAVGTPVSLTPTNGVASYSFKVTPSVATQYEVQVASADTPTATSRVVTIYASVGGSTSPPSQSCSHTRCKYSIRLYTYVPTSQAYTTESGKHWYLYQAVWYGKRLPKDYTLSTTARASKVKKVNGREFAQTFTYYIPLRNGGASWAVQACVKDTESKDGLGLPGHHGCGAKHVSVSAIYLG